MEGRHAVQHYSKERFKVHLRFVMPRRSRKLSSQGDRQETELLKNSFSQPLHTKTTNSGCCPSKIVLRRISLLVCCTAPNRVARR